MKRTIIYIIFLLLQISATYSGNYSLLQRLDGAIAARGGYEEAKERELRLLEDGYLMIQYSVYARGCVTHDRVLTHTRRLKSFLPPRGRVRCLFVTNIQWQKTFLFYGDDPPDDPSPEQLAEQLLLW